MPVIRPQAIAPNNASATPKPNAAKDPPAASPAPTPQSSKVDQIAWPVLTPAEQAAYEKKEWLSLWPKNLHAFVVDKAIDSNEWKQILTLKQNNKITAKIFQYLPMMRIVDPSIAKAAVDDATRRVMETLKADTSVRGREAARLIQSGKAIVSIENNSNRVKEIQVSERLGWNPYFNAAIVGIDIPVDAEHPVASEKVIRALASRVVDTLAAPLDERNWMPEPELRTVLWDYTKKPQPTDWSTLTRAVRDRLTKSEVGRSALADVDAKKIITFSRDNERLFEKLKPGALDMRDPWGGVTDEDLQPAAKSRFSAAYYTAYNPRTQKTVIVLLNASPAELSHRLIYASALQRTKGDIKAADEIYATEVKSAGLDISNKELLEQAFDLLKQTKTGKPIAERLIRDNVTVELTDKRLSSLSGGTAGGIYNVIDNSIRISRPVHSNPYDIASTLAHEGEHYQYFQRRDVKMRSLDYGVAGLKGLITAPFQGKNPLAAAIDKGWDKGLDTEREAFLVQSKVQDELGVIHDEVVDRHDVDTKRLHSKGSIYQVPDLVRYPAEAALGVGLTGAAATMQHFAFKKMGKPSLGWKPTLAGLGLTGGLIAHDYLNRHLEGDNREAFNIARIGLGTTAALAGAKYVSSKFMGSAALSPFKLRYALGTTALAVGIDYLKNRVF